MSHEGVALAHLPCDTASPALERGPAACTYQGKDLGAAIGTNSGTDLGTDLGTDQGTEPDARPDPWAVVAAPVAALATVVIAGIAQVLDLRAKGEDTSEALAKLRLAQSAFRSATGTE
jgi:hypothetical protein